MNDTNIILGIRILKAMPISNLDFYIEHEFIGDIWKQNAINILPLFLGKPDIKIQTLHYYNSHSNCDTIWIDNYLFTIADLDFAF